MRIITRQRFHVTAALLLLLAVAYVYFYTNLAYVACCIATKLYTNIK